MGKPVLQPRERKVIALVAKENFQEAIESIEEVRDRLTIVQDLLFYKALGAPVDANELKAAYASFTEAFYAADELAEPIVKSSRNRRFVVKATK